ncbi:type III secretion system (T3SS) SseB-like protein [Mumia flava]|uniref:Type III secretion system (T3SS) SseB-like protein n=1 Tax=Mumia flava TaxID=1348852 RepID=A0A0B2BBK8_9ACTN|nr:SseB family protein [Mumia flava]PJJ55825.1 type III secretion system (T3SS) SseB-like protein [Mumia flava]
MSTLAQPAFPDDDGAADPRLAAALHALAQSPDLVGVLGALSDARVLVPVVAVLGESESGTDKEADMATVMLTGADGRRALLAFSSLETLGRWRPDARPVPVRARDAARAAIDEGATALIVDLAGPVRAVVETDDLRHLATGDVLVDVAGRWAWAAPGEAPA